MRVSLQLRFDVHRREVAILPEPVFDVRADASGRAADIYVTDLESRSRVWLTGLTVDDLRFLRVELSQAIDCLECGRDAP